MSEEQVEVSKYSFNWARSIVSHWMTEHARATEFFNLYYDVTFKDYVGFLASGDPIWAFLKRAVTTWEKWDEKTPMAAYGVVHEAFTDHLTKDKQFGARFHVHIKQIGP